MKGHIVLRILLGIVLIAAVAALGVYVYNAGVAQGMLASGQMTLPEGGHLVAPYYMPHFYRPWGFGWGFGIIPLLLGIFLIGGLFRLLFFRPWRHMHGIRHEKHWAGWRGGHYGFEGGEVPPMVAEWHRRMHETPDDPSAKEAAK